MKTRPWQSDAPYTIGHYIWESRRRMRLSIPNAAFNSGLSAGRYRLIETDQRTADPDTLWAIIQALDMRPREAFRCARIPGAFELPEALDRHARSLTAPERQLIGRYLDSFRKHANARPSTHAA